MANNRSLLIIRQISLVRQWLAQPGFKLHPVAFSVLLLIATGTSVFVRHQQYSNWLAASPGNAAQTSQIVSTADAYLWIRWADEISHDTYATKNLRLFFPDGEFYKQATPPLLSVMLAKTAAVFGLDYVAAGNALLLAFSGLFILPLALFFYIGGYPVVGLFAGFIGAFAPEYLLRTSIGRIDTDMLNLFFPSMAALLVLLGSKTRSWWPALAWSAAAGGVD